MNKKKVIIIAAAVIIVVAAGFSIFGGKKAARKIDFVTEKVQKGNVSNSITATGTIEPVTEVEVGTQVSGIIDKIYIEDEKFPGFITKLSKDRSFYTILEKDYNIQPKHAVLEIDGIIAQNQHADLLKCNIGDPLFSINKISYDFEDKPIHYSSTIVRCDRATYVVHTDNSNMMNTKTKSK